MQIDKGKPAGENPGNNSLRDEVTAARISQVQNIPAEIAEKFIKVKGILVGSGIEERFREWQRKNLNF